MDKLTRNPQALAAGRFSSYLCDLCKERHEFVSLERAESGMDCTLKPIVPTDCDAGGRGSDSDPKHAAWQAQVLRMAREAGFDSELHYHTHDSRKSDKGYPDLHVLHLGQSRSVYIEIKVGRDKPSKEQKNWQTGLIRCGHEAYVFYPYDEAEVRRILKDKPPAKR